MRFIRIGGGFRDVPANAMTKANLPQLLAAGREAAEVPAMRTSAARATERVRATWAEFFERHPSFKR